MGLDRQGTPVLWNGDVYYSIREYSKSSCQLLKYSTSTDSWSDYSIPCDQRRLQTDHVHVLTTYHSKLLLIGSTYSQVWEFDANVCTFKPSPDITLPESRESENFHSVVAAASDGDYLLIVGQGRLFRRSKMTIFNGSTWIICDGPYQGWITTPVHVIVHNNQVFVADRDNSLFYEAPLHLLIKNKSDVWQKPRTLPARMYMDTLFSNFTILDNHLCIAFHDCRDMCIRFLSYLADRKLWLEVGNTTESLFSRLFSIVGLPNHNVIMMDSHGRHKKVKPGEPNGAKYNIFSCISYNYFVVVVYNPHGNLTVEGVCKLDIIMVPNTPLLDKLEPKLNELSQRGRFIPLDEKVLRDEYHGMKYENEFSKVVTYILSWVRCWGMSHDVILPSWKNFFTILREISPELSLIADQIEADFDQYLTRQPKSETEGML